MKKWICDGCGRPCYLKSEDFSGNPELCVIDEDRTPNWQPVVKKPKKRWKEFRKSCRDMNKWNYCTRTNSLTCPSCCKSNCPEFKKK